jgi:hypothetical protein
MTYACLITSSTVVGVRLCNPPVFGANKKVQVRVKPRMKRDKLRQPWASW